MLLLHFGFQCFVFIIYLYPFVHILHDACTVCTDIRDTDKGLSSTALLIGAIFRADENTYPFGCWNFKMIEKCGNGHNFDESRQLIEDNLKIAFDKNILRDRPNNPNMFYNLNKVYNQSQSLTSIHSPQSQSQSHSRRSKSAHGSNYNSRRNLNIGGFKYPTSYRTKRANRIKSKSNANLPTSKHLNFIHHDKSPFNDYVISPNIDTITVGLGWDATTRPGFHTEVDVDSSILIFDNTSNLNLIGTVYYGHLKYGNCIEHKGDNLTGQGDGDDEQIVLRLQEMPKNIGYLAIVITIFGGASNFRSIRNCFVRLKANNNNDFEMCRLNLSQAFNHHTGMIMCYLTKLDTNNCWKLYTIAKGANGKYGKDLAPAVKNIIKTRKKHDKIDKHDKHGKNKSKHKNADKKTTNNNNNRSKSNNNNNNNNSINDENGQKKQKKQTKHNKNKNDANSDIEANKSEKETKTSQCCVLL